jgi:hypothetical protein
MNQGPALRTGASGNGFRWWLSLSCAVALVGFTAGLVSLGGYGGYYVRQLQIPYNVLLPTSMGLSAAWLATLVIAVVLYRRRGLWLLVVAPVALCWPTVFALLAHAIATCVANHPGNAGGCDL